MDNFIDTSVIISNFRQKDKFHIVCERFINNNSALIISFYQKNKELPYFLKRARIKAGLTKRLIFSPDKEIPSIKELTKEDKSQIKKILSQYELGIIEIKDIFENISITYDFQRKINRFLKTRIKRTVTKNINENIVNILFKFNNNKADSRIIASAIQEHQQNQLVLVTTDKKDWKQEYIEKSCTDNSYKKIPEVRFLQDK